MPKTDVWNGKLKDHLRYLSREQGWSVDELASFFEVPADEVLQVLAEGPDATPSAPWLTLREVESMRNDYRRDPYMTPAQRREALRWIADR